MLNMFIRTALTVALGAHHAPAPLRYTVDLNDRADSVFKVTLRVDALTAGNDIFQFAATAPGTYQVMDIGRFVRRFQAFDANGNEVPTSHVALNQWRLSTPERVKEIRYAIAETWSSPFPEHAIYRMCGSNLRADHTLMNGQAVFGMPRGMQATTVSVQLLKPADWTVSTPLELVDGVYLAEDYDRLVDSPILAGHLSSAQLDVTGVPVRIAVYSTTGLITATHLRDAMKDMLEAAGAFLGKLPVDRYTFIWDFEDRNVGAWEHSYGSEYTMAEAPFTPQLGKALTDIAAHEFFHVVTPLNLHSDIIEHFNFETPVPSQHIWLYEGTTEWAAHKMQLESGLKPLDVYLAALVQKVRTDRLGYDTTWSLVKMSLTSYSDSGQAQYPNIYQRGAIVAGLLDIKLLDLSGGAHGMRDLIQQLSGIYGKQRAFPDDSLFDIIVARTSPELADFLHRYIRGNERPPVREYYAKLGIRLIEDARGMPLRFELDPAATPAQLALRKAWLGPHGGP